MAVPTIKGGMLLFEEQCIASSLPKIRPRKMRPHQDHSKSRGESGDFSDCFALDREVTSGKRTGLDRQSFELRFHLKRQSCSLL